MGIYLGNNQIDMQIGQGGTTPTGEISITNNGVYDVANYASANVAVESGGSSNGYNVTFDGGCDWSSSQATNLSIALYNGSLVTYAAANGASQITGKTISNVSYIICEIRENMNGNKLENGTCLYWMRNNSCQKVDASESSQVLGGSGHGFFMIPQSDITVLIYDEDL